MRKLFTIFLLLSVLIYADAQELPRRGTIGLQIAPLSEEMKMRLKIPGGILVENALSGSSAEIAGLEKGDVIVKANEIRINDPDQFVGFVRNLHGGDKLWLVLIRNGKEISKTLEVKPRPQETHADFDILYKTVVSKGVRRRVIITKPKTGTKNPAILFLAGVGCFSQDNLPSESVHRQIFYALTKKGFVTMRVEKSGMGDSEGASCNSPEVDFETETAAYIAGLNALKTYDFVDAEKIFLFGHSMGGISAPVVASQNKVAGVIVAETVGKSWFEYELENLRRQMILAGIAHDKTEKEVRQKEYCNFRLYRQKEAPEEISKTAAYCFEIGNQPPAPYTYMRQVADLNLAEKWKKANAPTLVIYGTSDYLTSAEEHEFLTKMLNKYRPNSTSYVEIPNMDHGFAKVVSQADAFNRARNSEPAGEFNKAVLAEIEKWLAEIIKQK